MITNGFITMAAGNGWMAIFSPLYWLFGKIMEGLLFVFNDQYFLALVVFTLLTRLVLFPLNLRQQKTMAKTNRIQPKIQKIQKKYNVNAIQDSRQRQKANQQMQQEIQELYSREGHNPMNMGCGPMMFQMVFLMGIIGIIYYPIQYILNIDLGDRTAQEAILAAVDIVKQGTRYSYPQLELLRHITDEGMTAKLMAYDASIFTQENIDAIVKFKGSLQIAGIDMTEIPSIKNINATIIVPVLCLISSLASSVVSTLIQRKTNPAQAQQNSTMLIMMLMMPLFSTYISFQVPAAVGFYWIISNVIAVLQQLVTAKFFPPKYNIARQMVESTIERRAREESIKKVNNKV